MMLGLWSALLRVKVAGRLAWHSWQDSREFQLIAGITWIVKNGDRPTEPDQGEKRGLCGGARVRGAA